MMGHIMNWKTSVVLCAFLLSATSVQAQHRISGYVYELQSGEPLEGVRIQMKNRQGLAIGTLPATYSNAAGYFEFTNVKPRDYRAQITHTFETPDGPMGLQLFTNNDVIAVASDDYALTIGLSQREIKIRREAMALGHLIQKEKNPTFFESYEHQLSPEMLTLIWRLESDWINKFYKIFLEEKLASSQILGNEGQEIRAKVFANPIQVAALSSTSTRERP